MPEDSTDPISINLPDAFPWGIAVIGRDEGTVLAANAQMKDLYSCEVGGDVNKLFRVDEQRSFRDVVNLLEAGHTWNGRIIPQENHYGIASVEIMLQREVSNEARVWLYTLEHPRVNNDVRYSSRSELKMLRVLLDNTLEYIYFRDVAGHFILSNKAFKTAVTDGEKTPEVDHTIVDFVSEESAQWFEKLDRQLVETGRAVVNEVFSVTLNSGLQHWLQLSIVPVCNDEGEMMGTLSVARDISDLKRTEEDLRLAIEQARAASKAKGEFLAAMSHEIRTPINGIIGATELCEETRLDQEQRSYIDTVLQCGNTLLALVNDVLDFSKIEAGQLNLEKLNFVPRTLLENIAESFVHETRKKGVELITAYDEQLPSYLMGDPTRLKQVLNNLVSNAVKFTERGEIVIRAQTLEINKDSAWVRFSVSDSGIGIAEGRREAIFESFTQEDMSTTRKYGGTGLGLSISRQLVEMMKGRISVTSEVGQGSVFACEIPFEISTYHGAEVVPFNPELAGLRVLIVDDNETNREIYGQMCASWGYRSTKVESGSRALFELKRAVEESDPFELVILDQQMPELTGLDVASMIRSRPELKAARLIILSSSLDRKEAERATEIGVARALSKPVKRDTLLEVILETFEFSPSTGKLLEKPEILPATERELEILLVEDNPVNQVVARQRLQKLGHKVTVAGDSRSALKNVSKQRYNCILMDIQMPEMDGYETTAEIRKFEKENGYAPQYIVAMTAHVLAGDKERCLNAGMDNYISKPFRVERLKEVLKLAAVHEEKVKEGLSEKQETLSTYLAAQSDEDREDLLEAALIYLENLPDDLGRLQKCVEEKDYEKTYFTAHNLKSVMGYFGRENAFAVAENLEDACKKKIEAQLSGFADEFAECLKALGREIELELKKAETRS